MFDVSRSTDVTARANTGLDHGLCFILSASAGALLDLENGSGTAWCEMLFEEKELTSARTEDIKRIRGRPEVDKGQPWWNPARLRRLWSN